MCFRKPGTWVTPPTLVLLKPDIHHIEVFDRDKPSEKAKANKTRVDLLDNLLEEEEPPHTPEHFIASSSRALEASKADLDHTKDQYRQAQDTKQAKKKQIESMQNTINMVQAELQELKRRSDMVDMPISYRKLCKCFCKTDSNS